MSDLPGFIKYGTVFVAIVLSAWFVLGFVARARFEFRTQILELLALATQRQQSVLLMLNKAQHEFKGARRSVISIIIRQLDAGSQLSDSLAKGSVLHFPPSVTDCIRAAEGGDKLASMLRFLASMTGRASMAQHRLGLALIYPAILAVLLLGLHLSYHQFFGLFDQAAHPMSVLLVVVSSAWGILSLMLIFYLWSPKSPFCAFFTKLSSCCLPSFGKLRKLNESERQLRSLSMLLESGLPFSEALRRAGICSADPLGGARFSAAAQLADSAAPIERVWEETGLPSFVRSRATAVSTSTQKNLASVLLSLASECERRFQSCLDRSLAFIQPICVLFFGGILAFKFIEFFAFLDTLRAAAMPW